MRDKLSSAGDEQFVVLFMVASDRITATAPVTHYTQGINATMAYYRGQVFP